MSNASKLNHFALNEEYFVTSDTYNLMLNRQCKNKDGDYTTSYTTIGYYSNVTSLLRGLTDNVVLTHSKEAESLEQLLRLTEGYVSKSFSHVLALSNDLRLRKSDKEEK